jgi:hypothetical protein
MTQEAPIAVRWRLVRVLRQRASRTRVMMLGAALLLAGVIWIGSVWVAFHVDAPGGHYYGLVSNGQLELFHSPVALSDGPSVWLEWNVAPRMNWWFTWETLLWPFWRVGAPLWIAVLVLGIFFGLVSWRALHALDPSHCPSCGYSRVGLELRPCPECGHSCASACREHGGCSLQQNVPSGSK